MGIRIHKALGWALTNLSDELVDPRLNPNHFAVSGSGTNAPSTKEYFDWLEQQYIQAKKKAEAGEYVLPNMDMLEKDEKDVGRLRDCFISHQDEYYDAAENPKHTPELNNGKFFLIRPISMKNWYRYDDAIDYYVEATSGQDDLSTQVTPLPSGVFPWQGIYIRTDTGERLDRGLIGYKKLKRMRSDDRFRESATLHNPKFLDAYAQKLGFKDSKELEKLAAPEVPEPIQALCEFTQLFVDPKSIYDLRPALCTWWS